MFPEFDPPRYRCHTLIREFLGRKNPSAARGGYERISQWFDSRVSPVPDPEIVAARWLEISIVQDPLVRWLSSTYLERARTGAAWKRMEQRAWSVLAEGSFAEPQ